MDKLIQKYVDEYTDVMLRTAPKGTVSREEMFNATAEYLKSKDFPSAIGLECVHIDYSPELYIKLKTMEKEPNKFYVITCLYSEMERLIPVLGGQPAQESYPIERAAIYCQMTAHLVAELMYRAEKYPDGYTEEQHKHVKHIDKLARTIGSSALFDRVVFVTEPPTEFKKLESGKHEPVWA